jgi:hypothetical protein
MIVEMVNSFDFSSLKEVKNIKEFYKLIFKFAEEKLG